MGEMAVTRVSPSWWHTFESIKLCKEESKKQCQPERKFLVRHDAKAKQKRTWTRASKEQVLVLTSTHKVVSSRKVSSQVANPSAMQGGDLLDWASNIILYWDAAVQHASWDSNPKEAPITSRECVGQDEMKGAQTRPRDRPSHQETGRPPWAVPKAAQRVEQLEGREHVRSRE